MGRGSGVIGTATRAAGSSGSEGTCSKIRRECSGYRLWRRHNSIGPRRRSRARRYRRGDGCVGSGAGVRARVGPGVRAPAVRPGGCARASLEPASFDAAFSRFGVMFFSKPAVAFSNIRRSLRPKGRLSFVCWRTLEENSLDNVPLTAASLHLPPQPAQDPDAPGPFAFANPGSGSPHSENSGLHGYRDNCL
jgi:SAM-dependent methyltransferase